MNKQNIIKETIKEINEKKIEKDLVQIIGIPSISEEEGAIAGYLEKKLQNLGLQTELDEVEKDRYNIIATLKGKSNYRKAILLTGHMDTVSPTEGWSTNPFKAFIQGDRVFGLGACDMKGGLTAILAAIEAIQIKKIDLENDIIIAFVVDEEMYSKGMKQLIKRNLVADFALVAEPNFDKVILGWPGKFLIKGKFKGKAGHAEVPKESINAIEEAANFISNLKAVKIPSHQKIKKQPFVILNIKGGYDKYSVTIPDKCEIILNKHTIPGEDKERVLKELRDLALKIGLKSKLDLEILDPYYPSCIVDENNSYVRTLRIIYKEVVGTELKIGYSDGVCDANLLASGKLGIPTAELGPAGGPIHSPNEWVSKDQIKKVTEIYIRFLLNFAL